METFIYQAELLCGSCGTTQISEAQKHGIEDNGDSDTFPQPAHLQPADSPVHCGQCGLFLDNDLTYEGYRDLEISLQMEVDRLVEWLIELKPHWADWFEAYHLQVEAVVRR